MDLDNIVMQFLEENALFMLAIWATTYLFGGALPRINNKLIALVVGFLYGVGAYTSHLLEGTWFNVIFVKASIASVSAQIFHDRFFKVLVKHGAEAIDVAVGTIKKNEKNEKNGGTTNGSN